MVDPSYPFVCSSVSPGPESGTAYRMCPPLDPAGDAQRANHRRDTPGNGVRRTGRNLGNEDRGGQADPLPDPMADFQ